ncbi:MAG: thiS [Chthoniobacter sp.]|jgi:thiamine biosynthesis protein ThiS|nr:thiS [Chthoniobacter sp.]
MRIALNGETRDLAGAVADIAQLIETLGVPRETALVEHNGLALRRDEWTSHTLADGDRVEIIRIVAGG